MPEHFSAADTAPSEDAGEAALEESVERDAEAQLLAVLERVHTRVEAVREQEARQAVDPLVLAALARAGEAEGAPFEARWLADRVRDGEVTWAEVWRAPEAHEGGLWLWSRAAQELAGALR